MQLLHDFLVNAAVKYPQKTALIAGERQFTYVDLWEASHRFANGLRRAGLKRGDRLAILLPNSWEFVAILFGCLEAGGVVVPINPAAKPESVRQVIASAAPRILVTDKTRWAGLEDILPHAGQNDDECFARASLTRVLQPGLKVFLVDDKQASENFPGQEIFDLAALVADGPSDPTPSGIDIDLAMLIYTSGSTGVPKGVMLTQRNMVCATQAIAQYLGLSSDDVILNVLPLSFDYGLYQVLLSVAVGATIVLEKSFTFPAQILPLIARYGVTGWPIVPTIGATLLNMDLDTFDLSSLRFITSTAAAWSHDHILRLEKAFGHPRIFSMYGLTECKRVSYLPPEDLHRKPGSVGIPIPNSEVMLLDDSLQEVQPGMTGQLYVRGGHVMAGYWQAPEATKRRLVDGRIPGERWLRTGDLFRQDEEGFLYFVGRVDDMIKSRGEKVSPREIEDHLHRHPHVAEAAIFGVPDQIQGQAIVAYVSRREGCITSASEVRKYLTSLLESYKIPSAIRITEALPHTANGKIDKDLLKKIHLGVSDVQLCV